MARLRLWYTDRNFDYSGSPLLQAFSQSRLCRANDRRACRHSIRRSDHREVRGYSRSRMDSAGVGTSSTGTTSITPHRGRHRCVLRNAVDRRSGGLCV